MLRALRILMRTAGLLMIVAMTPGDVRGQQEAERGYEILKPPDELPKNMGKLDTAQVAKRVVERTNAFRVEHQLGKLDVNDKLTATARAFGQYMAKTNKYGHLADGRTPAERAKDQGYDYCIVLENIAFQYHSEGFQIEQLAKALVEGWEESREHRENMLDPDITETGVAVVESRETGYFFAVQMFGRPSSQRISVELHNSAREPIAYTIDGRRFELLPRQIRTHERCRPPTLVIEWPGKSGQQPQTLRPTSGSQLTIERTGQGSFTIRSRAED